MSLIIRLSLKVSLLLHNTVSKSILKMWALFLYLGVNHLNGDHVDMVLGLIYLALDIQLGTCPWGWVVSLLGQLLSVALRNCGPLRFPPFILVWQQMSSLTSCLGKHASR